MRSTFAALERAARLLAVADRGRPETVLLEIVAQQAADLPIVVDDEDMSGGVCHGVWSGCGDVAARRRQCEAKRGLE